MKRIQKLDDRLIAQIAAGEVIESPAAIVKELVENSIDAGASDIEVFIRGDGFEEIQVRDNGSGIHPDDLELAVTSFATSKISNFDDLIHAQSLGFRGEALGSIAAVSRMTVDSCFRGATEGRAIQVDEHGRQIHPSAIGQGTRTVVRDLFYNVPVRRDYYQNAPKIRRQITDVLTAITAGAFAIAFRYQLGDAEPVILPARVTAIDRLCDIWGTNLRADLMPVYHESDGFALEGYISKFYFYRTFAGDTRLWVNGRPVDYRPLTMILRNAYGELMPKGRFPFAALYLTMAPEEVDVNVHPQKREIRFKREAALGAFLRKAFQSTIATGGGMRAANMVRIPAAISASPAGQTSVNERFLAAQQLVFSETNNAVPGIPQNLVLHTRIFNTFILATNDEGVFLIDQHTAHERINYEKFLKDLSARQDIKQYLTTPLKISRAVFERDQLQKSRELLEALGFELNDLGPAGFGLVAVPMYIQPGEEEAALHLALDAIVKGHTNDAGVLFDQMAKDLSCRHAIRKRETASLTDFREIVEQLKLCENPLRCPHGRPTFVKIDEREVFALFKRAL